MLKKILLLPLLAVILFGCKKETPPNPDNQDNSKNNRLVKQISQYWSEEPQIKTIIDYYYNDKKQLIREVERDQGEVIDSTIYLYNSRGNLKYELRRKYLELGMDTVNKYFYDASDRLI